MRKSQRLPYLLKRQSIHLNVAQLIKELRLVKNIKQEELCERAAISRQYLSEIENGHRRQLNLVKVEDIVNACGEQLYLTTSYRNPLQISDQTEREDQVLRAYAEGQIEEADALLAEIYSWRYPAEHIMAKCKRNMAIAISYHFKGLPKHAIGKMNNTVMGLSQIDCGEEDDYFTELFYRIIGTGDQKLSKKYQKTEKGALS